MSDDLFAALSVQCGNLFPCCIYVLLVSDVLQDTVPVLQFADESSLRGVVSQSLGVESRMIGWLSVVLLQLHLYICGHQVMVTPNVCTSLDSHIQKGSLPHSIDH